MRKHIFDLSISLITKTKLIAFAFSLISIVMLVYFFMEPILNKEKKMDLKEYMHIFAILLSLLTNLLLYQAILDYQAELEGIRLNYWPNQNYCVLSWIIVHLIVFGILFFNMLSCFYLLNDQNSTTRLTQEKVRTISKTDDVVLNVFLIIGQLSILLGMKMVIKLLKESNSNGESDVK
jgi:hypothetical protein